MNEMALQIRLMQSDDAEQMHKLYQQFCLDFVGCAKRDLKQLRQISRKRDNMRWVAIDEKGRIAGYVYAVYAKGRRTGRIIEIITDPEYDFAKVARLLVSKVYQIFLEKGAAQVQANTILNPHYSEIFPKLGFQRINTDGVFMYAITDVAKFLGEIEPIVIQRLGRLRTWSGSLQIMCEDQHILFKKTGETVQSLSTTNSLADCKILLGANTLIRLLLGAIDIQKTMAEDLIRVETSLSKKKADELLDSLFPKRQFLVLDYW